MRITDVSLTNCTVGNADNRNKSSLLDVGDEILAASKIRGIFLADVWPWSTSRKDVQNSGGKPVMGRPFPRPTTAI